MDAHLDQAVRERAGHACEYCRVPQAGFPTITFHVDHVISQQHHGPTALANLCLACPNCNNYKGPNIGGSDPRTGRLTRLYNRRRQRWERHFRWEGPVIVGRTAVGRVTVDLLNMNDPEFVLLRSYLIEDGLLRPDH